MDGINISTIERILQTKYNYTIKLHKYIILNNSI